MEIGPYIVSDLHRALNGSASLASVAIIDPSTSLVDRVDKNIGDVDVRRAGGCPNNFFRDIMASHYARWVGTDI